MLLDEQLAKEAQKQKEKDDQKIRIASTCLDSFAFQAPSPHTFKRKASTSQEAPLPKKARVGEREPGKDANTFFDQFRFTEKVKNSSLSRLHGIARNHAFQGRKHVLGAGQVECCLPHRSAEFLDGGIQGLVMFAHAFFHGPENFGRRLLALGK